MMPASRRIWLFHDCCAGFVHIDTVTIHACLPEEIGVRMSPPGVVASFLSPSCGLFVPAFFLAWLIPFRTAVPFWRRTTLISGSLSPQRDCGAKKVCVRIYDGLFFVAMSLELFFIEDIKQGVCLYVCVLIFRALEGGSLGVAAFKWIGGDLLSVGFPCSSFGRFFLGCIVNRTKYCQ